MSEQFDISVIMPVYNTELYLRDAIDSIIHQSKDNIELIIINDGSTDKSSEIIGEYVEKFKHVVYIEQANKGQGAARNAGLKRAKGKYIYFMDSDDLLQKGSLEVLYEQCEVHGLDMIMFDGDTFYDNQLLNKEKPSFHYKRNKEYNGVYSGIQLLNQLIDHRDYLVSPCLYLCKRSIIEKNCLAFPEGIIHEDELFTFQLYLYSNKVKHIKETFFKRRIRENSTMTTSHPLKSFLGYSECFLQFIDYEQVYRKAHADHPIFMDQVMEKALRKIYNAVLRTFYAMEYRCRLKYRSRIAVINRKARDRGYFGKRHGFLESHFFYLYQKLLHLKEK